MSGAPDIVSLTFRDEFDLASGSFRGRFEQQCRSNFLNRSLLGNAVPDAYRELARAGRGVTEPHAQRLHGGQGGTRGEVPWRTFQQEEGSPEHIFWSRRDRRLSFQRVRRFPGAYAARNGDSERISVVYRCRTSEVLQGRGMDGVVHCARTTLAPTPSGHHLTARVAE